MSYEVRIERVDARPLAAIGTTTTRRRRIARRLRN
jgi:hypothetical protein